MFSNRYIPVWIVGLIEGIIIPLSIYAFLTGCSMNSAAAAKYTLYASAISAFIMALGAYFTREEEVRNARDSKILRIYQALDIEENIKQEMTRDTLAENQAWQKEWDGNRNITGTISSGKYGILIFFGYLAGILIVLLSIHFIPAGKFQFMYLPVLALMVSGFVKYKLSDRNPVLGLFLTTVTGTAAAIGAYYVASLF